MEKENKTIDKGLIVAIVCITVIALLVCGATFILNNKQINNTVNTNEVTNTEKDLETDEKEGYNLDDESVVYETSGDISKYVAKLKDIYGYSDYKVTDEVAKLLKEISFESLSYETYSQTYDNIGDAIAYMFFINKEGQDVECGVDQVCKKYSESNIKRILGYYGFSLSDSIDNERITKDVNGDYIVKMPITGIVEPIVQKEFSTFKNGDYVYLQVIYTKTDEDNDENTKSIMLHTFKINNGSYTIIRSQRINLLELADNTVNIILSSRNEEYHIGKYNLLFTGTQDGENNYQPVYKYLLSLKYDDRNLKGTAINTSGHLYSDSGAARFYVTKIDNVYVLNSQVATIGYYQSVVILDNSGNVLKEYAYVDTLSIEGNKVSISYTTDTSDSCHVHGGPETGCVKSSETFTISGNKLIK